MHDVSAQASRILLAVDHPRHAELVDQHAGQALLTIEDSGPGIPADQRQRVLERFHRLPSAAGGQAPGCGLGLAIVQHVVDQHGGSLSLDVSPSLHGLHVSVRLPLRPEDREENRS